MTVGKEQPPLPKHRTVIHSEGGRGMAKPVIGDRDILEKRMPHRKEMEGYQKKHYGHIQSTIDTGPNHNNTKDPSVKEVKRDAHEHFKRIKPSTLHRLLTTPLMERETKVLVIDVREQDDYSKAHIADAIRFPPAKLCHAMHPFLPEMHEHLNKENHIVVAYDLDDTMVQHVANQIFERGMDNIYVLTGGLYEYVRDHVEGVVGEPPIPPPDDRRPVRKKGLSDTASSITRGAVSGASSFKPKSLSSSTARPTASSNWR
eukprot:Sspe_Gene.15101::Locus_5241_Transcript_1_3_Confidence_0.500_Length_1201::g.15101::m.15101/K16455/CEP41, TSGA14; centrosomal protein CEP41